MVRENVLISIAYNGRRFQGFQRQPKMRTVEGELVRFIKEKGCWDDISRQTYSYGGRTDAGVNAIGQIVSFSPKNDCQLEEIIGSIEDDILIWGLRRSLYGEFKARQWTLYRDYLYVDEIENYSSPAECIANDVKRLLGITDYHFLYKDYHPKKYEEWYFNRRILKVEFVVRNKHIYLFARGESFPLHFLRRLVCFLRQYDCESSFDSNIKKWRPCLAEPWKLFLMRAMVPYYPMFLFNENSIIDWLLGKVFRRESSGLQNVFHYFFSLSWFF